MKYIVFCLLFIASLVFSCNRKTKQYFLRGRLIHSCDGSPDANQTLRIRQYAKSSGLGGSNRNKTRFEETIVTNANGEFELIYETNHTAELEIDIDGQEGRTSFNLPVESIDLGDIHYKGKLIVYCKIKVTHPYTNMDTLVYSDIPGYPRIQMVGPFHDTVLGIRNFSDCYKLNYNWNLKKVEKTSPDIVVNTNYQIKHVNVLPVSTYSNFPACKSVPDTFVVTIN